MTIITFYDIDYWNVAEKLYEVSSIIGFFMILTIFVIVGFSSFNTFQIVKPLNYYIMLSLNMIVVLCFTVYYAVVFSFILSISLYMVYDKCDIPNLIQLALKGATGLNVSKVKKQLKDFEMMTEEEKKEISDNIPDKKKIKINFLPWLIVTFVIPSVVSIAIKLIVKY